MIDFAALEQGWDCSFGKAKVDGGPSTMYVRGICAGQIGIWRSTDGGTTWQMIGGHPPRHLPSRRTHVG